MTLGHKAQGRIYFLHTQTILDALHMYKCVDNMLLLREFM